MKDSEIKYQAVGDRLLVRPVKFSETLTDSGIILPDEAESKMLSFGRVINLGSKCSEEIKVGDIVYFEPYTPKTFEGEEDYIVISESDILVIGK